MKVRAVNYSDINGKAEMLVSVDNSEAIDQIAYSPQDITEPEATFGALYNVLLPRLQRP